MLGRALKMAFWVTYDHLGKLVIASLLWSLSVSIPAMAGVTAFVSHDPGLQLVVGIPCLVLCIGVVLPVMSAGIAHMVKELIDTRDGSLRTMLEGIRLYWRRAIGVGFAYLAALVCLPTSVWFYASKLREQAPLVGYALSALALWCLLFIGLMSLLVVPTLVQKKANLFQTLKLTALLVLDNPLFSVGLAMQVLAFTAIAVVLSPVFFFLYGGMVVALTCSAYEMLARKYDAAADTGDAGSKSSHVRGLGTQGAEAHDPDEDDDYLNRGLRDFLFPWKG